MMNSDDLRAVQDAAEEFISDPDQWGISLSGTGAVYQLEQRFARLVGHPYALAVANATMGLLAVFMSLEIHGADVLTTPYTWGGSLAGLILTGNRPVFADIDRNTLTLDPEDAVRRITPKTRAILAVDIYGYPCDGQRLRKIADDCGLILIQDCAQSFGAYIRERHTGWWADAVVFSLTVGKTLFAGEGGMVVTPHQELFEKLVWQTQHSHRQLRDVPHIPVNELAMNLRIHPLAAIWAEASFEKALAGVAEHRETCNQILNLLREEGLIQSKPLDEAVKPSFHTLTFEPRRDARRIELFLQENGMGYSVWLPPVARPIYRHESYRQLAHLHGWPKHNRCPVAESQCRRRLRLKLLRASQPANPSGDVSRSA